MFHLVPNALCGALYPLVVQRLQSSPPAVARREQRRLAGLMLAAGLGLAGIAWALAGPLLGLFYGADFAPALAPLRAQAASLAPLMLNGLAMLWLYAAGRPRTVSRALVLGALFKLALGAVWIGRQGSMGAAWTVVAAEVVLCLLYAPLWMELFGGDGTRMNADERG